LTRHRWIERGEGDSAGSRQLSGEPPDARHPEPRTGTQLKRGCSRADRRIARFARQSGHMQDLVSDPPRRPTAGLAQQHELEFAAARAATVERLVRAGMPPTMADAWIATWDESTAPLHDFRHAPDYWKQGYRFAQEEYRRGYKPWG
jgi:hypothetical protein